MYQTRIKKLQALLKKEGLDYFLFADADGHFSEYVGDYFKMRTAFSGFTGSNGTLLVGRESAYLWTDGRYFIQAQMELEGSGITLMKMGTQNVPTVSDFICGLKEEQLVIGVDADYISYHTLLLFRNKFRPETEIRICKDFVREILENTEDNRRYKEWKATKIRVLPAKYFDYSVLDRIKDVRNELKRLGVEAFFSGKLDSNMWLLGIRGNDIAFNPYAFSFVLVTQDEIYLMIKKETVSDELRIHCKNNGILLGDYEDVLTILIEVCADKKIASAFSSLNAHIAEQTNNKGISWIDNDCGLSLRQAVKSEAEIAAIKEIYRKDSAAVCKFLYWLSQQKTGSVTEYEAACKINELRAEIPEFLDLSFRTIAAYGSNAAMMHYEPEESRPVLIKEGNVFLLDSGGQYDGGTTDVTRTLAIGNVSEEVCKDYTAVVRGMLALQNAHFMYGCTGMNLDILARAPIWERNMNYNCSTGHGIGFMLGVHEGPQAIRIKATFPASETPFSAGMLVSDEPGIYKEGKYGIRIENILLCREACRSDDGIFMEFEPLTFVPLEPKLICMDDLSPKEYAWLKEYQNEVCRLMEPYLTNAEFQWLSEQKIY